VRLDTKRTAEQIAKEQWSTFEARGWIAAG
jgi:hypothetical protein